MLSMHLRQLFRKPARVIIFILILVLLTAFFCVSLNLYANSMRNLKLADNAYTTIAVMEIYADVDKNGNVIYGDIANAQSYMGRESVSVFGFDIQPILSAPGVKGYDRRMLYGGYSPDNIALNENGIYPLYTRNVIHFKVIANKTAGADSYWEYFSKDDSSVHVRTTVSQNYYNTRVKIEVIDSAINSFAYDTVDIKRVEVESSDCERYADEIHKLGGTDACDYISLEPGEEYIATINSPYPNSKTQVKKVGKAFASDSITILKDLLYIYNKELADNSPFYIYKYSDVANNAELAAEFKKIAYATEVDAHSFKIMSTNNALFIPAFHSGNFMLHSGRMITQDEYSSGAKVCMISRKLAAMQKWSIGQKINFSMYDFYKTYSEAMGSVWFANMPLRYLSPEPDDFFDSGEYEIVGIYDLRQSGGNSEVSEDSFYVPWNTIYIPEKSLENAPAEEDRPVTGALLTIWLENGKIEPFIERMNELGITGAKQGDYEARFTFYDQGYSRIQPSLEALSGTAELLLILSSSLLVIAALLLAFFYAQSQKQSIGTMRLLGCSKARAFAAVMLSALIIAVTGALIGAAIGHALTASVGESIMANANQTPEEFLAFSAYLAESTQVEVEFALGADAKVSLLTCIAALVLFIVGTLVFVVRYLGKGPRELLPRAGE